MEGLRYLAAALSAVAVAAAVHGWLRRESAARNRGAPSPLSVESPLPREELPHRTGFPLPLHLAVLLPLALLMAWADRHAPVFTFTQSLLLLYLLYPLALLDWMTMEVELRIVAMGLLARIAALLVFDRAMTPDATVGMLAGAGMMALAALGYRAIRGRAGLGEGDAGVLAISGAFVGLTGLVPVLLLAAAAGVVVGVAALFLLRKPLDTPIPFVPFLCAATLAVYLAQHLGWRGLDGG